MPPNSTCRFLNITICKLHKKTQFTRNVSGYAKKNNSAIEKWYELKPELFKEKPNDFKNKLLTMQQVYYASLH